MSDKHDMRSVLEHYGTRCPEVRRWSSIRCVLHDDKQASASVSPDREMFFCHACNFEGDVYAVIMRREGVNFKDAVERAERITNGKRRELSQEFKRRDNLLPQIKRSDKRGGRFIPTRYSD